ncbi:MFS transporter [Actinomadura madurae]|uniref:Predicted arabinose efflux permease, MFS family n=1 Tax=Actinomadura madurae TaxID=1993 RepID=A0A1I5KQJ1_9ACTN|nr:MFS transporter [Actinomadura madurae]SFO87364.1 Predicted arabinose efflux permease, MFS family [Actinomadura madurae]SPT49894.1 Alpha-ketoglutarate permease [Actinomadura madurae]
MPDGEQVSAERGRRAMLGAWFGFFVDLFDIYLPIVTLAPAIAYFVSPDLGTGGKAIVNGAIFAATLLGRPIGAAVFGRIADTLGRRRATIMAMSGAAVSTLLIALLPGFHQVGIVSVVAFVVIRFVGGIFLGGEYTGANPLAMEATPPHKRGLYSGIINTGFPLAYAAISLITLFLLLLMPAQDLDSAYVQWGWRIPFVIGAVLTVLLVLYFRRSVDESEVFASAERAKSPIKELFARGNRSRFIQVFVLMSGFWLSMQPVTAVLPSLLGPDGIGLTSRETTLLLVVAYLLLACVEPPAAALSQRIGRRRYLTWSGMAMIVIATPALFAVVRFGPTSTPAAAAGTIVVILVAICPWAVLPAYINERFPTSVRASGYGLAYSLAVVLPSFYAFYQAGLGNLMPFDYTGTILLLVGALLVLGSALAGPETTQVDLHESTLSSR